MARQLFYIMLIYIEQKIKEKQIQKITKKIVEKELIKLL